MKTKIFLASSPNHPNNNLFDFYSNLRSNEDIDLLHPTSIDDVDENDLKNIKVLEYEFARSDKLKILESTIVIIDWDSEIKNAYLYWSCINPNSKTIVVSKTFPDIDLFVSERVIAVVKPELLLTMLYSYLETLKIQEEASQDKQDPAHD
jgi:hypothetical protein